MNIAIANDHAGTEMKFSILKAFENHPEIKFINLGTDQNNSVDYPDFAHGVSNQVSTGAVDFGILICGSGNGICMAANKHEKIRAALCWNPELGALARQHNDANILCLPARFISFETGKEIVDIFLKTQFEGGRHQGRVSKIPC